MTKEEGRESSRQMGKGGDGKNEERLKKESIKRGSKTDVLACSMDGGGGRKLMTQRGDGKGTGEREEER